MVQVFKGVARGLVFVYRDQDSTELGRVSIAHLIVDCANTQNDMGYVPFPGGPVPIPSSREMMQTSARPRRR